MVNGHGYRRFIDLFLKPFLSSKIDECLEAIEEFNDEVIQKLGPNTVKRTNVKLQRGPIYSCQSCELAAKSVPALNKHRKLDHRQSTGNNSVIESLMIEDLTVTELSHVDDKLIEENSLKYRCKDCNVVAMSKRLIDVHVKTKHLAEKEEKVRFVCTICQHEIVKTQIQLN